MFIHHSKLCIQFEALVEVEVLQCRHLFLGALHALVRLVPQVNLAELLQPRKLLGNQHTNRALRGTLW